MKHYIIDGNNLAAKIKTGNKNCSRQRVVKYLSEHFAGTKNKISIYFDGYEKDFIPFFHGRIYYSGNKPADYEIRHHIENSNNPRLNVVVSSDHDIINLARACACEVIKSEEFVKKQKTTYSEKEAKKISSIDNSEFFQLFGVKK